MTRLEFYLSFNNGHGRRLNSTCDKITERTLNFT